MVRYARETRQSHSSEKRNTVTRPSSVHGKIVLIDTDHTDRGRLVEYEDLSLPYFEPSTGKARHMVYLTMLNELEFGEGVSTRLPSQQYQWFDASAERLSWLHQNSDALS